MHTDPRPVGLKGTPRPGRGVTRALRVASALALAAVLAACATGGAAGQNAPGSGLPSGAVQAAKPDVIRLDYAYYSPTSLVLKEKGWAEEAFGKEGIGVTWTLSLGSNKALQFLDSDSVDFGSSAGAAAFVAASQGAPIETVYIYSKPEWTALVTTKDSSIRSVRDLKGKKVAATVGTDPFIFLLRALDQAGLSLADIQLVNLQHGDGAAALLQGQVDAWAGLDPYMARLETEDGARLVYRNPDFNTYGFLSTRRAFAENYPQYVEKVIELYEKARKWTLEHPDEATAILAKEAQLAPGVARLEMQRNDFSQPVPGDSHRAAIKAAAGVLQREKIVPPGTDVDRLVSDLIQPSFAEKVVH